MQSNKAKRSIIVRCDRLAAKIAHKTEGGNWCMCGHYAVDVHHWFCKKRYANVRFEQDNLVPVCRDCHIKIESKGIAEQRKLLYKYDKEGYSRILDIVDETVGFRQDELLEIEQGLKEVLATME